jgi:hypothetical protein
MLVGVGSAVVLGSGFLPWLRLRRAYSGFELARLVGRLGDEYPVVPPSWLGITWYVLPLLAALSWVVLFAGGPVGVRRVHAVLGVAMSAITLAYGVAAVHYGRLVAGEMVACGGALLVCAGAVLQLRLLSTINRAE